MMCIFFLWHNMEYFQYSNPLQSIPQLNVYFQHNPLKNITDILPEINSHTLSAVWSILKETIPKEILASINRNQVLK